MWNLFRCLSLVLICCLCTAGAVADGGAFKRLVEDPSAANMPDQRAILAYSNGIETLAIQTRFEGNPAEFAWVVPLPAVPKVTACSHGTFKTMPTLMSRRVISNEPPFWVAGMFLLMIIVVMYHVQSRLWSAIICVVLFLFAVMMIMPSLGKARGSAAVPTEPVLKVHTEEIGNYEVNILSSKSDTELIDWLTTHGFDVSERSRSAIAAYVKDRWVFVASRASRARIAAGGGTITPHALTFEFPTPFPVYPMRLTGANNTGPLEVTLYTFGSGTASAPGWTLKHSDSIEIPPADELFVPRHRWPSPRVVVSHSGLRSLIASHTALPLHATCLNRTFQPADMNQDVVLQFGDPEQYQEKIWSSDAAIQRGMNIGMLVMIALWIVSFGVRDAIPTVRTSRVWLACTAIPIIVMIGVVQLLPRSQSVIPYSGAGWVANELYYKAEFFGEATGVGPDLRPGLQDLTEREAYQLVESWLDEMELFDESERPKREDSPGNYLLEREDGHWIIRFIDVLGQECRIRL